MKAHYARGNRVEMENVGLLEWTKTLLAVDRREAYSIWERTSAEEKEAYDAFVCRYTTLFPVEISLTVRSAFDKLWSRV